MQYHHFRVDHTFMCVPYLTESNPCSIIFKALTWLMRKSQPKNWYNSDWCSVQPMYILMTYLKHFYKGCVNETENLLQSDRYYIPNVFWCYMLMDSYCTLMWLRFVWRIQCHRLIDAGVVYASVALIEMMLIP